MSMPENEIQNQAQKEPMMAKVTRTLGITSSLIVVGGLAWWAYNLGSRDATNVPVISAITNDLRTAPGEAGGEQVDYQGNQVNGVLEGNPPALTNDITLAPAESDLGSVEPAQNADGSPIVSPDNQTAPAGEVVISAAGDIAPINAPERRPELLYIPPKDQMNPLSAEARPVGEEANGIAPVPVASASEIVEGSTETITEQTTALPDVSTPNAESVPAARDVAAAEVVVDTPTPAAAESDADIGPRLASGTPLIQLAANTVLADTQAQWKQLQAKHQDVLGDKKLYVEKKNVNGKLYYRLRVSGFSDSASAQAVCSTLISRNLQCLTVNAE